ncbi:lysostaphin resistance A-like protein [Deinococcus sp.]|uniref:CPBP family intramembrane glutamic endopeptidase n=1 Tax=Deinococcus sp. TaxID=47478 RepID=UPI003CC596F6
MRCYPMSSILPIIPYILGIVGVVVYFSSTTHAERNQDFNIHSLFIGFLYGVLFALFAIIILKIESLFHIYDLNSTTVKSWIAKGGYLSSFWLYFPKRYILPVFILSPILEEFTFRYLIMGRLVRRFGFAIAFNIFISVIFTTGHLYSIGPSIYVFIVSLALGVLYLRKGIGASILAHASFSVSLILLTFLTYL